MYSIIAYDNPTDSIGKVIFNGSATNGNVALNESFSNFKYIDVIIAFTSATGRTNTVRVFNTATSVDFQNAFNLYDNNMNVYYRQYTVTGTTITVGQSYMWASSGFVGAYYGHYILKVIGYK